ncbi:unnamed protein product [Effrenium voratum]|uniref:Uncharacterized protein n=1 Tax=Effrenium voratum TaxID=2562239 RepID=A0AA36NL33_9DINO|nr:unnamed protein product [Effrenium voratum]
MAYEWAVLHGRPWKVKNEFCWCMLPPFQVRRHEGSEGVIFLAVAWSMGPVKYTKHEETVMNGVASTIYTHRTFPPVCVRPLVDIVLQGELLKDGAGIHFQIARITGQHLGALNFKDTDRVTHHELLAKIKLQLLHRRVKLLWHGSPVMAPAGHVVLWSRSVVERPFPFRSFVSLVRCRRKTRPADQRLKVWKAALRKGQWLHIAGVL